jgi:hypothetical protein
MVTGVLTFLSEYKKHANKINNVKARNFIIIDAKFYYIR